MARNSVRQVLEARAAKAEPRHLVDLRRRRAALFQRWVELKTANMLESAATVRKRVDRLTAQIIRMAAAKQA